MNEAQKKILEKHPGARLQKLVYVGVRPGNKTKRVYGYVKVSDDDLKSGNPVVNAAQAMYWKKSLYPGTAGTVIEIVMEEGADGVSIWKAVNYVGRWPNREQCVAWQAEHDETVADLDSKKDAMHDSIIETLAPVAKAYRHSNRAGRAVLLAKVIRYLTASSFD